MPSRTVAVTAMLTLATILAPTAEAQNSRPPESRWVEIGMPFVAKRGNTVVLAQTITSTSNKEKRWAIIDVNGTEDTAPCTWLKVIEPNASYRFECPLKNAAGQKYEMRVRIFRDEQLNDREIHWVPEIPVSETSITRAEAAPSGVTPVPLGTFDTMATTVPATFKSTWYRRVDKGFGMRAYENSGDLTVSAEEVLFVDGKKTVRVPYAKVESVRWEPLPNDIANHWIVVRFTNDEGKPDGIAFRDGARMGTRGKSGPMYQAVRQGKK